MPAPGRLKAERRRTSSIPTLCLSLICLLAILATTTTVTASTSIEIIDTDDYIRLHLSPPFGIHTSKTSNRTVLAYITPWNTKGLEMVDKFHDKIDMVSPVWYTILVQPSSLSTGNTERQEATYILSGGPPDKSAERWLERKSAKSSLQITPRFYLDNWQQSDYANLLSNPLNWQSLSYLITQEVEKWDHDGVVFESAATHLLFEPLQTLSTSLKALPHKQGKKTLTVVLPPLRTKYSLGGQKLDSTQLSQNRMIVQSIPQMAQVVDFFSIMTYDMSSAGGRVSNLSGKDFPKDSPIRGAKVGSLRHPGPNTSPYWIGENIKLIEEATVTQVKSKLARSKREMKQKLKRKQREEEDELLRMKDPSNPFLYDEFQMSDEKDDDDDDDDDDNREAMDEQKNKQNQAEEEAAVENGDDDDDEDEDELGLIRGKLLMGMPMYGYQYPLFWIEMSTGQGKPVPPPSTPHEAEQLFERSSTNSDSKTGTVLPFLRGPGEALTMDKIVQILTDNDGVIINPSNQKHADRNDHDDGGDGEGWFDYMETITKETLKQSQTHGVKQGDQIYWRLYLPLSSTTKSRLQALERNNHTNPGVSLWELGQSSPLLLQHL